jgi:hypothetical protein
MVHVFWANCIFFYFVSFIPVCSFFSLSVPHTFILFICYYISCFSRLIILTAASRLLILTIGLRPGQVSRFSNILCATNVCCALLQIKIQHSPFSHGFFSIFPSPTQLLYSSRRCSVSVHCLTAFFIVVIFLFLERSYSRKRVF